MSIKSKEKRNSPLFLRNQFEGQGDYYGVANQSFRLCMIINSDKSDQSFRLG